MSQGLRSKVDGAHEMWEPHCKVREMRLLWDLLRAQPWLSSAFTGTEQAPKKLFGFGTREKVHMTLH